MTMSRALIRLLGGRTAAITPAAPALIPAE